jgi:diaminopimelate decarboxylase
LTPAPGNAEEIYPRKLAKAHIGDGIVVEWTWAYCASMSARNYNSYPTIAEILLQQNGKMKIIRKLEKLTDIRRNEKNIIK